MFAINDTWRGEFSTYDSDGDLTNASVGPAGVVVVNGTDTAITVNFTNPTTGRYKLNASLSTLSLGDIFYVRATATVDTKAQEQTFGPYRIDSTVASRSVAGDAMTLTAGQRVKLDASQPDYAPHTASQQTADVVSILSAITNVPGLVWASGTRTLTAISQLSGITSLANWLRAMFRSSAADATALSEINNGGGTFAVATDSQEALGTAVALLGSSSGSGARTVVVTVVDDDTDDELEDVLVRFTEGANAPFARTDADGEATFGLDELTYGVAATKPGYSFTPTTHQVTASSGTWVLEIRMTAVSIPAPADPEDCTVYLTVRDLHGDVVAGQVVQFQAVAGDGTAGVAIDDEVQTETSDVDGLVQIVVPRGWRVRYRGSGQMQWRTATVADAPTMALPEVIV